MEDDQKPPHERFKIAFLICVHIVICCVSLIYVSYFKHPNSLDPWASHFIYEPAQLPETIVIVAAFSVISCLFIFSSFSFGYFVGFYFYTMVLGYLWLNCFSDLNYDHRLAGLSAAASTVAFLLPALLISSPVRQIYTLSARMFEHLLTFILLLGVATVALGACYNFRLVSLANIYDFRDKLDFPTAVGYLLGIASSTLLPFAFACFVAREERWKAGGVLFLLLLFYPITLSKLALFTPFWLVLMVAISRIFGTRIGVVLSLFGLVLAGVISAIFFNGWPDIYFDTVNFRMIAVPSSALDVYNEFFSNHDLTHFCQVSFLKVMMSCPYQDQLSVILKKAYNLGNLNASLFATEGIASVGPLLAPVAVFVCGLVVALGNRLSAGLPARFIFISGAILPQVLLNVPLTTVLMTHGAGILFLLWYITPRTMFEKTTIEQVVFAVRRESQF